MTYPAAAWRRQNWSLGWRTAGYALLLAELLTAFLPVLPLAVPNWPF